MRRRIGQMSQRFFDVIRLEPLAFLLGALFFIAALSPSLIPRSGVVQGVLAGAAFSAGYLLITLLLMLWQLLHLRKPQLPYLGLAMVGLGVGGMVWALSRSTQWQEELHLAMNMPPVESVRPLTIAATALGVAYVFILIGRFFQRAALWLADRFMPWMPERLALVLGVTCSVLLFNFVANDLIVGQAFKTFDATYARLNAQLPSETKPPQDPLKVGSAQSLIPWAGLGREGQLFVSDPLDGAEIARLTGVPAQEPLRVYVGLGSAPTPKARAELALAEAIRIGAFDRKVLVIHSPTGTGWIDAAGQVPLEVLTGGDVATISVQYSYLPSWLSLLALPDYGRETARAVFAAIHGHWRDLPEETRPKLYLFGLSLGALNSQMTVDFFDTIEAPIAGAYWVGPPFASVLWGNVTADRVEGSPEWLPRYRDGRSVRFMAAGGESPAQGAWGRVRVLYLQYASDPITFFSPSIFWRAPDWMDYPRGAGVIDSFRWLPVVTGLQVGFDLMTATTTPMGYGHVYSGGDYMAGWAEMLSPLAWDEAVLTRTLAALRARGLHPEETAP